MTNLHIATRKPLTKRQQWTLEYLADLDEEFETRDYSVYGEDADLVRGADIAFMSKVGHAFNANRPVWS